MKIKSCGVEVLGDGSMKLRLNKIGSQFAQG